ncbi:hypothetical protein [Woeseia oceani]|uniref:Uncharacterized protein n=1 Tax=Woeseia oceani TaxID=1548547 RepID=A0A193LJL5_9GAMM|nr:hypothetical protein [Woeseia oceani]ANO52707.1 hypothetical protein BA177_17255 [Woeseia oceani]
MSEQSQLPYGGRLEGDPNDVLADQALSPDQRCAVLEDWIQDLLELQTATEEAMLSSEHDAGEVANQYQRVNAALNIARSNANPEQAAARDPS